MRALQVFVVLGSSLLFLLQPLVGRLLLPMHGGSAQVWTTCMLFFQLALLAGYAYAHFVLERIGRYHRLLLLASLPCATLALEHIPARTGSIADILRALTLCIALPFIVLATTSLVAQTRAVQLLPRSSGAEDPYSLYAYSNLGSLLGLLCYPFALEPWLGLGAQRALWASAYVVYVGMALWLSPARRQPGASASAPASAPVPRKQVVYWVLVSAAACSVLLGLTNVFALGAGSIPLIWVLTLASYLLGFVAAFSGRAQGPRDPTRFLPEVIVLSLLLYAEPSALRDAISERAQLIVQLFCLFWLTFCACAELYRTRPDAEHLTGFYLAIACGGALGGVLVSLLAPLCLHDLYEYPLALLCLAAAIGVYRRHELRAWLFARTSWAQGQRPHYARYLRVLAGALLAGFGVKVLVHDDRPSATLRNFYGLYAIWDYDRGKDSDGITRSVRLLSHNGTNHGIQSQRPDERCLPTGYFHRMSALGELLAGIPAPRRAAVIGLGTGTIASYFDARDTLTFYELDADSVRIAHEHFSFLDGCPARPRIVLGDARIELARDKKLADHSLDVLIIDAFSGDSVPFHLLTREAQALYLRKLAPGGMLIFHVSSRFYDLWPTIASTARGLGLYSAQRSQLKTRAMGPLGWSSQYLVVSRDRRFIDALAARGWVLATGSQAQAFSDDRASLLFPLLRHLMRL